MNITKMSNLLRMIAFFLTAIILCCTFGFTVDGWFEDASSDNPNNGYENNWDENNSENITVPDNTSPPTEPIVYYNQFTGLICTEEEYNSIFISYILDQNTTYGLSQADVIIEIPIENDKTRLIAVAKETSVFNKIGSFAPMRDDFFDFVSTFSDISFSYGYDDNLYPDINCEKVSYIDLKSVGYNYSEFGEYIFTSSELLDVAIESLEIDTSISQRDYNLFNFYDNENISDLQKSDASVIKIHYSPENNLSFIYNDKLGEYILYKNDVKVFDQTSGRDLYFANCLVLFSDFTTYETMSYTQSVISSTEGKGLYFTQSGVMELSWSIDTNGDISFCNKQSVPIVLNRGKTYISVVKSSKVHNLEYK